ncbi:23S rRNA (adenine(2503)-C(2))-methyltransferase RlmN [Crocinitomix algicola]|uniref:23S rRNA (adenine(2503)-C(2))-methyltransferase RlmN n=1 Tax=Crocinitomix algicola TaxID=1740263 RepID=UPI0008336B97|nr:23S rRNA (adenine(2503)-C(2))-methyltransferase RlmN [Crocinitomix algicola]
MAVTTKKINIRTLSQEELISVLEKIGEKKFRAKQVYEWIWKKGVHSFDQMRNISKKVVEYLDEQYFIDSIIISDEQQSNDGTIKCAFKSHDNHITEGVLIPTTSRITACISSQVGCSLACKFCATGRLKLMRNLTAGEIYDQVLLLTRSSEQEFGKPLSNIVFMGMGEPLLNYKNMIAGIDKITSEQGLGISPKRITVSTAGIAKMIKKLGDDKVKFNLALSLHAANDEKRSKIMEINDSNNLEVLADALRHFYDQTGSRVTFEYIIFKDFNDSLADARELADYCKNLPVKINIIEYNPIDDGEFQQADKRKVDAFAAFLESLNLVVNIRRSRGKDIDAACGQLANKNGAIALKERSLKK